MKICCKCNQEKTNDSFYRSKTRPDGLQSFCKDCSKAEKLAYDLANPDKKSRREKEWRTKNPWYSWTRNCIESHKRKGHNVQVEVSVLEDLARKSISCQLCGQELNWDYGKKSGKATRNSPSLDRTDNDNIITIDNIMIICVRCNTTKQDRTLKEFAEYCRKMAKRLEKYL